MILGLYDKDPEIQMNAFNLIKSQIINSTSSMTSIPKPFKFLRLHYNPLKDFYYMNYENAGPSDFKHNLSDLLAVLVMVVSNTTDTVLGWVLKGNKKNLCDWGLEFIKSLSGNIGVEFLNRIENEQPYEDLYDLVNIMVPFLINSHSESEAIDLLLEVEKLEMVMDLVNQNNYKRICIYLLASSNYAADSDESKSILEIAFYIYTKFKEYPNALRVAMKLNNPIFIKQVFFGCTDKTLQLQLAFMLAKQRIWIEDNEIYNDPELQSIISNLKLSDYFKRLAKELDVIEPKHPEDVFKSHLEEKTSEAKLDSYKMNMAASIASSFINAGFGTEALLSKKDSDWFSRNKEEGVLNLLAGLGLINMWDIDCGPNELEKYMGANEMDPNKRAGYNIGLGVISSGVRDENNLAYAILSNQLNDKKYFI
jgi:26S proteasome regulatory subunit N1